MTWYNRLGFKSAKQRGYVGRGRGDMWTWLGMPWVLWLMWGNCWLLAWLCGHK